MVFVLVYFKSIMTIWNPFLKKEQDTVLDVLTWAVNNCQDEMGNIDETYGKLFLALLLQHSDRLDYWNVTKEDHTKYFESIKKYLNAEEQKDWQPK